MAISVVDTLTQEEQALVDFYAAHPGATWADALEALGLTEADENRIFQSSYRLAQWTYLEAISPAFGSGKEIAFRVKEVD
jgi:hypothetical protein